MHPLLLLAAAVTVSAAAEELAPGPWKPGRAPPGWSVVETAHHQLQSQLDRASAEAIAAHLESLLAEYEALLPGRNGRRKPTTITVKLFAERDDMAAYDPEGADDAWFAPGARELVAWHTGLALGLRDRPPPLRLPADVAAVLDPAARARAETLLRAVADDRQLDVAGLLAHEGWHRALHDHFGPGNRLPAWLEEGLGDLFAALRPDGQGGWRLRPISSVRLARAQGALLADRAMGLQRLLQLEREPFYAAAPDSYGWAELLVRWLHEHPDPARAGLPARLLQRLGKENDHSEATEAVFGEALADGLEAEFHGWVLALEASDPLRTLAEEFGDRLAPEDLAGPDLWVADYRLALTAIRGR